jgi:hypothetical protein
MNKGQEPLEKFWDHILSRDPERIRGAYQSLTAKEQQALLQHLKNMATESDWHVEQKKSALAALQALGEPFDQS